MSEVKVNKISPRSGTDVTLGDSGDTFTIPSGATINNQGTATNFGATGSASWTTTVKTADFTAVAGEGYFVNTTSGSKTVTLPAGVAGAVVAFKDYADTFDTNALVLTANGSDKIGGSTDNKQLNTEGIAATLIFIDSTQGWLVTDDGLQSTAATLPYSVDFLVIAGGGAGGTTYIGAGGGAGGFRTSTETISSGTVITVTVGDGGTAPYSSPGSIGGDGTNSSISGSGLTTITSAGGGGGGSYISGGNPGRSGGSGGGGSYVSGGAGNTPSTTPSQGNNGGTGLSAAPEPAGGGGGAGAVGGNGSGSNAGAGGNGSASSITGSSVTYAGGGGGSAYGPSGGVAGGGGTGGGGAGSLGAGANGTANLGGGGGGSDRSGGTYAGGSGGKGVVIISVPDANYSSTTTGSPTVDVNAGGTGKTVLTFTGSGSYTG